MSKSLEGEEFQKTSEQTIEERDWYGPKEFHLYNAETAIYRNAVIKEREWIIRNSSFRSKNEQEEELEKRKIKAEFSSGELESINLAWKELDTELKELIKAVFPEVTAHLLLEKINDIRSDRRSKTEKK